MKTGLDGLLVGLNLPDLWQTEAVQAIRSGHDVIVDAPTGAGKTRVFELLVESGAFAGQMVYTVPTRALANEKYLEWKLRGWDVGIATGDLAENVAAYILVATLETQRERIFSGNPPDLLVVDEYQMLGDSRRGLHYELTIALLPPASRLLLLSGSVRNPGDVADWLRRLERNPHLVQVKERPVPLDEVSLPTLPKVPDAVVGFWPRMALAVGLADLAPLLIFAPKRVDSERIAKQIAGVLPEDASLPLTAEDEQVLGKDLYGLLRHRVAYHHSGLSYQIRSGYVERLAKYGHLRVIVATTGLAAGINFSVRSVHVADTRYFDGFAERQLRSDEILQMLGRAGRRGLDTRGYVITARNGVGILDAAPLQLRRAAPLDWPSLLRVMESSENPIEAALKAAGRLFSRQIQDVGFSMEKPELASDEPSAFDPRRWEWLDADGEWKPAAAFQKSRQLLRETLAYHRGKWIAAERVPALVSALGPGRLCRLGEKSNFRYGKELTLAVRVEANQWRIIRKVAASLGLAASDTFSLEALRSLIIPLLAEQWVPIKPDGLREAGDTLSVLLDAADTELSTWQGPSGQFLYEPPNRQVFVRGPLTYQSQEGNTIFPRRGTPAYAFRKLLLVDEKGVPTLRGKMAARFQDGEGLLMAAALEQENYPVESLVLHLANVRGGHRFAELAGGESERLAAAMHQAYGHLDFPGYLESGLTVGYGEGTAEALDLYLRKGWKAVANLASQVRKGDLERAFLEWLSLLRHIGHVSGISWRRWEALQQEASRVLSKFEPQRENAAVSPTRFTVPAVLKPIRLFS